MHSVVRTCCAAILLAACDTNSSVQPETVDQETSEPTVLTLSDAVNGSWRSEVEKARDAWRNPAETLEFFELAPSDTVVEIWPGGGWYTNILAPYLASGGGNLIAAHWDVENAEADRRARLEEVISRYQETYADTELYGTIELSAFSAQSAALAQPNSVDAVLTFRNVHNWMAGDYTTKFFDDAFAALKPGGTLGIVEHRLPSSQEQEPRAASGYVHEDYVTSIAERAGFQFVASSEVNANPADAADHPFGVWTLPPVSRTQDSDGNQPGGFDAEIYLQIGESDRMTLKFAKPIPEIDD